MKKILFCWLVFLVVALILMGQCWSSEYITSIEIIPPNPIVNDSVTVVVKGLFPDYCHYMLKGPQWLWQDLSGNPQIILELSHWRINEFCPQAIKDFSVTFYLGQLKADSYPLHIVTIHHHLIFETPQISGSDTLLKFTVSPTTNISEEITPVPGKFELFQNNPNPFNQSTQIGFILGKSDFVNLNVYDMLGRRIKTLVSERLPAGYNSVTWNGTDESGKDVTSGIYLYELKSGDFTETRKLMLLK